MKTTCSNLDYSNVSLESIQKSIASLQFKRKREEAAESRFLRMDLMYGFSIVPIKKNPISRYSINPAL